MKIRLSIDFDSAAEYEAFRTNTSIEEVRQKAKAAKVELTAPKKEAPAQEKEDTAAGFKDVTPEDGAPYEEAAAAKAHTESDLKVLLSKKLKEDKKAGVKNFLNSHGADSLSALLENTGAADIDALYSEAEAI